MAQKSKKEKEDAQSSKITFSSNLKGRYLESNDKGSTGFIASDIIIEGGISEILIDNKDISKGKKPMITIKFKTHGDTEHFLCLYGVVEIMAFLNNFQTATKDF